MKAIEEHINKTEKALEDKDAEIDVLKKNAKRIDDKKHSKVDYDSGMVKKKPLKLIKQQQHNNNKRQLTADNYPSLVGDNKERVNGGDARTVR